MGPGERLAEVRALENLWNASGEPVPADRVLLPPALSAAHQRVKPPPALRRFLARAARVLLRGARPRIR